MGPAEHLHTALDEQRAVCKTGVPCGWCAASTDVVGQVQHLLRFIGAFLLVCGRQSRCNDRDQIFNLDTLSTCRAISHAMGCALRQFRFGYFQGLLLTGSKFEPLSAEGSSSYILPRSNCVSHNWMRFAERLCWGLAPLGVTVPLRISAPNCSLNSAIWRRYGPLLEMDLLRLEALPAYQSNLIAMSSPRGSLLSLMNFELTKTG